MKKDDVLEALIGTQIPGGCAYCGAVQIVDRLGLATDHAYMLRVVHDLDCPWQLAKEAAC